MRIDIYSPTWRRIEAWATAELEDARAVVETPAVDQTFTEFTRGRIAVLKQVLALAGEPTTPDHSAENAE